MTLCTDCSSNQYWTARYWPLGLNCGQTLCRRRPKPGNRAISRRFDNLADAEVPSASLSTNRLSVGSKTSLPRKAVSNGHCSSHLQIRQGQAGDGLVAQFPRDRFVELHASDVTEAAWPNACKLSKRWPIRPASRTALAWARDDSEKPFVGRLLGVLGPRRIRDRHAAFAAQPDRLPGADDRTQHHQRHEGGRRGQQRAILADEPLNRYTVEGGLASTCSSARYRWTSCASRSAVS